MQGKPIDMIIVTGEDGEVLAVIGSDGKTVEKSGVNVTIVWS